MYRQDGSKWEPSDKDEICSAHFVNNEKSDNQYSPNYIPTIFPDIYKKTKFNETAALKRHKRFMERRLKIMSQDKQNLNNNDENIIDNSEQENEVTHFSQECQVNFLLNTNESSKTFVCNRFVNNNVCDAETQTEISTYQRIVFTNRKTVSNKKCGTDSKEYADKCIGSSTNIEEIKARGFIGIESIKNDDQLVDLAGVTFNTFKLFADKIIIPDYDVNKCKITKENRLLIFFFKLKTGLSYSAIGVLFQVHRSTVSRIFLNILKYLSSALRNSIKWYDKDEICLHLPPFLVTHSHDT